MTNTIYLQCAFVYFVLVNGHSTEVVNGINSEPCFHKGFGFGVATAAYQIEGAWNVSGKGESIWDRFTHEHPERVIDHQNGDIADGSYYKVKEDVQLIKELGVSFYRFSVSWPRILPTGLSNNVSAEGIRYYKELIDELLRSKITPILTMYHWDLPQSLQDLGGWTNPIIAEYFADYARVLLDNFGDDVKVWLTFNEPLSICRHGYGGELAPGGRSSGFQDYMCGHNVLRAHGMVYRMFDKEYRNKIGGYMSITLSMSWAEPASASKEDKIAAETARQFELGWFANPIFTKAGDYPPVMRKVVDTNSKQQRFSRSRLPSFTRQEVEMIRGSYDFMGLNHYTTTMVKHGSWKVNDHPSYDNDVNVEKYQKEEWTKSNSSWLRVVPWGFRKTLNWIKITYNNPKILVTENGVSEESGLHDMKRVHYIDVYLRSLHKAIYTDHCSVIGYTYWSLLDNFEWLSGYTERFGLYEIDYSSPNLTRTQRLSAKYITHIAKTGCLPNKFTNYTSYSTD